MERWMKEAWIVVGFFVLIVPLGILVTWNYGDAWGEWSSIDDGNTIWTPREHSGGAPLPDYNVPGWESKLMASLGYWISAIIGMGMSVVAVLGISKAVELRRRVQ